MSGGDLPRADPRIVRALHRDAMTRAGEGRLTLAARPQTGEDRRRLGRSMLPALAPGDEIAWRAVERAPRVGEIAVFEDPDAPAGDADCGPAFVAVVHRVIGVRPDGTLVTKGDNRATADPAALRADSVIGVVSRTCGPGRAVDFQSRAARAYGRAAAWISAAGDALFRAAEGADAFLVRGSGEGAPDWSRTACARRVAWLAQRGAQRVLHAVAHRACHREARGGADG